MKGRETMLKIKKFASLFCVIAIVATALVMPVNVSATTPSRNLSYGVRTGNTAFGGDDWDGFNTSIIVTLSGLFNSTTDYALSSGGTLEFYVTKGALYSAINNTSLGNNGMVGKVNKSDVSYMNSVTPIEGNDEYDLLSINYYGADGFTTRSGDILEIKLNFVSVTDIPDLVIIPKTDSSKVKICDTSLAVIEEITTFVDTDYTYTVASGTNVVTKTANSQGGGEEDANKVAFEGFTGTKENGEADGSVAVATSKTFTTKADAPSQINWTVNLKAGGKGTYTSTVDATGGAEFTLGMVINGLAKELVASIEAVLVQ